MVDVNLIGGYLGAGKTSTVRHLLQQLPDGERVAVMLNDFGDARVDQALIGSRVEVREISGSCVCCTAPAGLVGAVGELLASGIDRILVEPTGLARPSDLIDTLRRAPYADQLRLGPLVVVIDPHLVASGVLPEEVREQAALADVLVINRVDLASGADLAATRAWVAQAWPGPLTVVETEFGRIPLTALRWPEGHTVTRVLDHDHHHDEHDFLVRSFIWPAEIVLSRSALLEVAKTPGVRRLKGVLRTDDGPIELQIAGARVHEARTDWRRDSRLDVVVGADDGAVLDAFERALDRARVDPEVLAQRGESLDVAGQWFDRAALAALPAGIADVSTVVPGRLGEAARLSEILGAAGIEPSASIVVIARDGLTTPATPLSELRAALLVHSLAGEALPAAQGGPFRLLVPGGPASCANVKGVVRLSVRR